MPAFYMDSRGESQVLMLKHFANLAFSAVPDLYFQKAILELVEQCVLVIPALRRQRQDNSKVGVSLDQRARLCLKNNHKKAG